MAAALNLNQLGKHKNAVLAAGLAVVAFLVLRARSAGTAGTQTASTGIDPATGLPYADPGVYSSGGGGGVSSGGVDASSGGVDATALAASLEGIGSGLSDLQTSLAQIDADIQASSDATMQAIQQQNDAGVNAGRSYKQPQPLSVDPASFAGGSGQAFDAAQIPWYDTPFGAIPVGPIVVPGMSEGTTSFTITPGVVAAALRPPAHKTLRVIARAAAPASSRAAAAAAVALPPVHDTIPASTPIPTLAQPVIVAAPRIGRVAV